MIVNNVVNKKQPNTTNTDFATNNMAFRERSTSPTVNLPMPENDEVLVKVRCSALDTARNARLGKGYHYAGSVETCGSQVTDMANGNDVFGYFQCSSKGSRSSQGDTLPEYIVVKRDECAIKPHDITHEAVVAAIVESLPALNSLRDFGNIQEGSSVLVIVAERCALGGAAVQIAKSLGAHVTAACCRNDMFEAKSWGTHYVLDRSTHPDFLNRLVQKGKKFDVIFDAPNILPAKAIKLLKENGTIVNTLPTSAFLRNKLKTSLGSKKARVVECPRSNQEDLDLISNWIKQGKLKITTDSTYTEELSLMTDC